MGTIAVGLFFFYRLSDEAEDFLLKKNKWTAQSEAPFKSSKEKKEQGQKLETF